MQFLKNVHITVYTRLGTSLFFTQGTTFLNGCSHRVSKCGTGLKRWEYCAVPRFLVVAVLDTFLLAAQLPDVGELLEASGKCQGSNPYYWISSKVIILIWESIQISSFDLFISFYILFAKFCISGLILNFYYISNLLPHAHNVSCSTSSLCNALRWDSLILLFVCQWLHFARFT
jgi:hypothetical protein